MKNVMRDELSRTTKHTPGGIPAMNKGKTKSTDMPPKKHNPAGQGGKYWKEAKEPGLRGSHKDMSSGASLPVKAGDDNKKRYNGVRQPVQHSNAEGPQLTKFVN